MVGGGGVVVATAGCTGAVVGVRAGDVVGDWRGGRVVVVVRCARGFGSGGLPVCVVMEALVVVVVRREVGRRRTGLVVAVG